MNVANPVDLLTPLRFDVVIKYLYAKSILERCRSTYFKDCYREHLLLWNGFNERGNPNKNTFEAFDLEFKKILNSIQSNGFDPNISQLPVSDSKYLLNGAHRLAASLALHTQVAWKDGHTPADGQKDCSWESVFKKIALPDQIAARAAIEYVSLKKNTYVVTLFPSACGNYEQPLELMRAQGEVVYYRSIDLKRNGPLNLMRELYSGESWGGSHENGFEGYRTKARLCFTSDSPTYVFLVQFDDLTAVVNVKEKIRQIFDIGKHSVHINDTHEETTRLAKALFNDNSVDYLNSARLSSYSLFDRLVGRYASGLAANQLPTEHYCITGSSVLSAYGLRECKDLDYLHHGDIVFNDPENLIHSHNNYGVGLYDLDYDEIVFNPANHFYAHGIKFAALNVIKRLKLKRAEEKDILDVRLINSLHEN